MLLGSVASRVLLRGAHVAIRTSTKALSTKATTPALLFPHERNGSQWATALLSMSAAVALALGTTATTTTSMKAAEEEKETGSHPKKVANQIRNVSFPLVEHNHGKAKVKILKVDRSKDAHKVYEYTVATKLFFEGYSRVFTNNDNSDLVATDTQRNTVYVVAKRTRANSPEQFAIDICEHFLKEYPLLEAVEVEADQVLWERSGGSHIHAFLKNAPETASTKVRLERGGKAHVTSYIKGMTVLKTTLSGFEDYLMDEYTLLAPTAERCLSTELDATWTYTYDTRDFNAIRQTLREQLILGLFGPPQTGVYSVSLQATVYDAACLILSKCSQIESIAISTPNKHYIPFTQLNQLGEKFEDDIFVPIDAPSGSIYCKVARTSDEKTSQ